jgi:cholesterol transport system auxiliary component
LLIAVPEAEMDLDVPRIAVAPSPGRIDYYADVAWADRPPAMMQELLLQAFERSGRIAAVERRGSGNLKADFLLTSDMQDFEVDAATGAPVAHLRITVRLVRTRDRTIVASRTFEATPSASGGLDGALAGFNAGLADMLPQIVDWTLTQGNANP